MSTTAETLASIRAADGLASYLDSLEERLARTVASHPGLVAGIPGIPKSAPPNIDGSQTFRFQ